MKFARVATRWIGEGLLEDKWRADMPAGYTRMTVLLDQYVNRAIDCPSPNIAVVLVREYRDKHKGYIDSLKSNLNQVVLDEWEEDGPPAVRVASDIKLRNFLIRQGMDEAQAAYIVNAPGGPDEGYRDRTEVLLEELSLADLRCRRQMELDRRA